jgi:type I restriction enzyme S subunit
LPPANGPAAALATTGQRKRHEAPIATGLDQQSRQLLRASDGGPRDLASKTGGKLHPYLRVANILDGYLNLDDVKQMLFTENEFEAFCLQPGDILLNEGQSLELVGRQRCTTGRFLSAAFRIPSYDSGQHQQHTTLLLPALSLAIYLRYPSVDCFRTTSIAHLGVSRFAGLTICVPPLVEQRRIAEILSTWDAAIGQTEKLVAAKERMKRGLLDRLFEPRCVGRNVRRLRLGQIADVNPSTKLVGDSVPFLEMAAVKTGAPDVEYLLERPVQTSGCTFRNGDTLFAKITPCAENGKIAFVDFLPEGKAGQGSTELVALRPDATLVRPQFLYALCRSRFVHPKVICVMEGTSGRQRIPTDAFREPFVPVPGLEEQDRVLQILNTADAELARLRNLTDLLRRQKQGLMQELLTGRVRVCHNNPQNRSEQEAVDVITPLLG